MDFLEQTPEFSRRQFLKGGAALTGAFVVSFHLPIETKGLFAAAPPPAQEYPPNAFIQIASDDTITFVCNKPELGQGVNTSMAQLIAEELECDFSKIHTVSAPVNPVYNHTAMPMQMTGGSSALFSSYDQHRRIGASMREMLIQAAAEKWGVPASECRAENGTVAHPKKGSFSYGRLAEAASKLPFPKDVKLKSPHTFRVIGQSVPRVDAREKSTGRAVYGIDYRLPHLRYAVIARPPVLGAKLVSVDDKQARAIKGVEDVVRFGDSVAVLGRNTWVARTGRDALKLQWDFGGKNDFTHDSLMADFKKELAHPGMPIEKRGDPVANLRKSTKKIVAEYEFPYLAHACMEPMNCTIAFDGERADLWAGHQMPTGDREAASAVLGIPKEKVTIHTLYSGGSFGRRASKTSDFVVEACQLAKIVKKPIKVVWTREDDMTGGYYRPMTYHRAEIGFDARHGVKAWNHRIVGQSVLANSPIAKFAMKNGIDPTVVEGVSGTAYDLRDFQVDLQMPNPNVTSLWWRSVGHTHTAYVMETMIDEIAHEMKKDPLALRKEWLHKSPRHLAVLQLLEEKSGWKPLHAGKRTVSSGDRAMGLAIHESFRSVVGHVVDVSYKDGQVRVHKVVSVVHCGMPINPDGARTQVEGAIIYGLSAALYGEMQIEKGQVQTANFDTYRVVRINEAPEVQVHFVPSTENPTGLGEPGVPPLAPAIANALFRITGKRLRKLPFTRSLSA